MKLSLETKVYLTVVATALAAYFLVSLLGSTAKHQEQNDEPRKMTELLAKANRGDSAAELKLGLMYESGQGVARDHSGAVKWVTKAAHGNAVARDVLRRMAEHGDDPEALANFNSIQKAIVWGDYCGFTLPTKPATRGDVPRMYQAGWDYYVGDGCTVGKQDYEEAYFWLALAIKRGPPPSGDDTNYSFWRDQAAKHITPAQRAAIEKRIAEWGPEPPAPVSK